MFQYILFDLDGTLTDSLPGILGGLEFALEKSGHKVPPREQLKKYCGPPLRESFRGDFGMTEEEAELAVGYYREYFMRQGIWENGPMPGMVELVRNLRLAGKICAVATSKPENHACMIVCRYGFMENMATCVGVDPYGRMDEKYLVVQEALRRLQVVNKEEAVLVGDRIMDVRAAHQCGIKCIGVAFGYGGAEELRACGADFIAQTPGELGKLLLKA